MLNDTYKNKTIVITGATEGIGAAIVAEFASRGASIFLIARDQKKLERLQDILYKNFPESRVGVLSVDVSSQKQVKTAVKSIVRRVSRIDGLVNNAGSSVPGFFENTPAEAFGVINNTKYMGAVYLTKEFIGFINEGGFISFTAGVTAFLPVIGYSSSVGPDFALFGFAQVLRQELAVQKIFVHVLIPPVTDTPGYREVAGKIPTESKALELNLKPLLPQEVAAAFMRDLKKRKFLIFVDFQSKLYYLLKGKFPGILSWLMNRKITAARNKKSAQ